MTFLPRIKCPACGSPYSARWSGDVLVMRPHLRRRSHRACPGSGATVELERAGA